MLLLSPLRFAITIAIAALLLLSPLRFAIAIAALLRYCYRHFAITIAIAALLSLSPLHVYHYCIDIAIAAVALLLLSLTHKKKEGTGRASKEGLRPFKVERR